MGPVLELHAVAAGIDNVSYSHCVVLCVYIYTYVQKLLSLLLQVNLSLKPDSLRVQALNLTLTPLSSTNPKVRINLMADQVYSLYSNLV